jgi:DNA-directed RNA polymerase specialized sigma24 family protein
MSWNDGHERRRFEQKQRTQANEYHKYGMNEEQIHAMYLQDLQEYRNDRIYAIHIQSTEELESDGEESRNALHKKFLLSMTCTMDMSECNRYGWIDEIEKTALHIAISKLTAEQKELLTLLYHDEYTQTEIAVLQQSSLSSVNKRVSRVCNRIRSLVSENGGLKND